MTKVAKIDIVKSYIGAYQAKNAVLTMKTVTQTIKFKVLDKKQPKLVN